MINKTIITFLLTVISLNAFNICDQGTSFKLKETKEIKFDKDTNNYIGHVRDKYCTIFVDHNKNIKKIKFLNDSMYYLKPFPSLHKIDFKKAFIIIDKDTFTVGSQSLNSKNLDEIYAYLKNKKVNRMVVFYENEKFKLRQEQICGYDFSPKKCKNSFVLEKKDVNIDSSPKKCMDYDCIKKIIENNKNIGKN